MCNSTCPKFSLFSTSVSRVRRDGECTQYDVAVYEDCMIIDQGRLAQWSGWVCKRERSDDLLGKDMELQEFSIGCWSTCFICGLILLGLIPFFVSREGYFDFACISLLALLVDLRLLAGPWPAIWHVALAMFSLWAVTVSGGRLGKRHLVLVYWIVEWVARIAKHKYEMISAYQLDAGLWSRERNKFLHVISRLIFLTIVYHPYGVPFCCDMISLSTSSGPIHILPLVAC